MAWFCCVGLCLVRLSLLDVRGPESLVFVSSKDIGRASRVGHGLVKIGIFLYDIYALINFLDRSSEYYSSMRQDPDLAVVLLTPVPS